jgi:hypothetical protein
MTNSWFTCIQYAKQNLGGCPLSKNSLKGIGGPVISKLKNIVQNIYLMF